MKRNQFIRESKSRSQQPDEEEMCYQHKRLMPKQNGMRSIQMDILQNHIEPLPDITKSQKYLARHLMFIPYINERSSMGKLIDSNQRISFLKSHSKKSSLPNFEIDNTEATLNVKFDQSSTKKRNFALINLSLKSQVSNSQYSAAAMQSTTAKINCYSKVFSSHSESNEPGDPINFLFKKRTKMGINHQFLASKNEQRLQRTQEKENSEKEKSEKQSSLQTLSTQKYFPIIYIKRVINRTRFFQFQKQVISKNNSLIRFKETFELMRVMNNLDHLSPEVKIQVQFYTQILQSMKAIQNAFLKNSLSAVRRKTKVVIGGRKFTVSTIMLLPCRSILLAIVNGILQVKQ